MKKVIHVIAPGGLAGAERVVLGGVDALRAYGAHHVELVVLDETRAPGSYEAFANAARARAIELHRIPANARIELSAIRELSKVLRDADVVHAHGPKALAWSWAAKRMRTKLVTTHHGNLSGDLKARAYEEISIALYKRCDLVMAVDEVNHAKLARQVGAARVALVENFLALEAPTPRVRAGKGRPSLLSLGRLSREKGLSVLLSAMADARAEIALTIAGDGPLRGELEAQVKQLGLEQRVQFLGFVEDVPALLERHDGLAMPSYREGMPMALIEALSAGLPVLATDVGGIPSIVRPNVNAVLSSAGDITGMARAIETFVHHHARLAAGAYESAYATRNRFSSSRWARQSSNHYDRLCGETRGDL